MEPTRPLNELFSMNVYVFIPAFVTTALSKQFTSRIVVITGGLFLFMGYFASIFATKVEHLFITYGILLGTCCLLLSFSMHLKVPENFIA